MELKINGIGEPEELLPHDQIQDLLKKMPPSLNSGKYDPTAPGIMHDLQHDIKIGVLPQKTEAKAFGISLEAAIIAALGNQPEAS